MGFSLMGTGVKFIQNNVRSFVRNMALKTTKVSLDRHGVVLVGNLAIRNGHEMHSFQGIRYAAPPVGALRFKDPEPFSLADLRDKEIDCTQEGSASIHKDPYRGIVVGSEDCLFLNIFAPKKSGSTNKLAVLVWIHGGAFAMDSGSENMYSPEYLVDKGVIVVTLNYRLGPLGFLHLPESGVRGNMGLKDQLMALKWVNNNIESFGGDPHNITLFGESAGAASVHLHVLSPESQPYFHKAILQSGTALMDWVMQKHAQEKAKILANVVAGKPLDTNDEVFEFLMKADPVALQLNALKTLTPEEKRLGLPIPFKPVVEQRGPGAILTKSPLELMRTQKTMSKPLILGYTSAEGIIMLLDAVRKLDIYDQDFSRLIPTPLNVKQKTGEADQVSGLVRKFYFGDKQVCKETLNQLIDIFGDYYFILGTHWTAELYAKMEPTNPLYMYRFSFDGELNLPKKLFGLGTHKGACHADDIFYLFVMKSAEFDVDRSSKSFEVRDKMTRMWTQFAKTGNPNMDDDNIRWSPVKHQTTDSGNNVILDALDIGDKIEMVAGPDKERVKFWRELFAKYNGGFLRPKL